MLVLSSQWRPLIYDACTFFILKNSDGRIRENMFVLVKLNHMYHEKEAYPFLFWPSQFCPDTTRFCVCIKIDKWTKKNIIQHSVMVFNVSFPFASLYYKAFHWICVKVFGGIYCRFDSNHAFLVLRSIISRHKVLVPSIISIHFRHRVIKLFFLFQAVKSKWE